MYNKYIKFSIKTHIILNINSILYIMSLVMLPTTVNGKEGLDVTVSRMGDTTPAGPPRVGMSWNLSKEYSKLIITWDEVEYNSQLMSLKELGRHTVQGNTTSLSLPLSLPVGQQIRLCLLAKEDLCHTQYSHCVFFTLPTLQDMEDSAEELPLYLVLGPIFSKNASVKWSTVATKLVHDVKKDVGYQLTIRKLEGRVGHPGHATNVVSSTHFITGLIPNTRYEVCVGETLRKEIKACGQFTTLEDVPGPPLSDRCTCEVYSRGTHWRCDAFWRPPTKTNGKIIGYVLYWLDEEGFVLQESVPPGASCSPLCATSEILSFHPHEVCMTAKTAKGIGWENCVLITDVSGRILAFFELKILLVVIGTLFAYRFGLVFLKALLRCCLRGIYFQIEEKQHPV